MGNFVAKFSGDFLFYLSYLVAIVLWMLSLPLLANYYFIFSPDIRPQAILASAFIYVIINILATFVYYLRISRTNMIRRVFFGLLIGMLIVVSIEFVLFILNLSILITEPILVILQTSAIIIAIFELYQSYKEPF